MAKKGKINYRVKGLGAVIKEFKNKPSVIKYVVKTQLKQKGKEIESVVRSLTPVKTGKLRKSIKLKQSSWNQITVGTDSTYAKFIEFGTKSHFIKPKTQKSLRWKQGGKYRFSKGHMVRGIKAFEMFKTGMGKINGTIRQLENDIIDLIVKIR